VVHKSQRVSFTGSSWKGFQMRVNCYFLKFAESKYACSRFDSSPLNAPVLCDAEDRKINVRRKIQNVGIHRYTRKTHHVYASYFWRRYNCTSVYTPNRRPAAEYIA